eukprot:TRINITY_DN47374_c0_g1_i1.p1 TRINITY_DN47374_c0_g1~~TRINITY_DN47374_c0_g1_i1.p1  ORF type:complete len:1408 (-),score=265.25 TRINITY_DN47374_c0_g1_i1:74-4297(-)
MIQVFCCFVTLAVPVSCCYWYLVGFALLDGGRQKNSRTLARNMPKDASASRAQSSVGAANDKSNKDGSGVNSIRKRVAEPFVNRGLESLQRISFLKAAKEPLLKMIVGRLQTSFVAPEEVLAREGETCDQIMFMGRGLAEGTHRGKLQVTYNDGSVIGPPLSLMVAKKHDYTVTTTAFADFMILRRDDFLDVLAMQQAEGNHVIKTAFRKLEQEDATYRKKKLLTRNTMPFFKGLESPKGHASHLDAAAASGDAALNEQEDYQKKLPSRLSILAAAAHKMNQSFVQAKTSINRMHEEKVGRMSEAEVFMAAPENSAWEEADPSYLALLAEEEGEAAQRGMAAWLDAIDFFSSMDGFTLDRLLGICHKRSYKRGEHLLVEGTYADGMHVLFAGNVSVSVGDKVVAKLGPKSILGERSVCVLGEVRPCAATVTALSHLVVTVRVPRDKLLELFVKHSDMYEHFKKRFDIERIKRGVHSFRNMQLLQDSDKNFVHFLEAKVSQRILQPGEILFEQGQETSEGYLLCRGSVEIQKASITVASLDVQDMKDAIIFGEFNVLGLWRAPKATVVARSSCLFSVITQDSLAECFNEYPDESRVFRELVIKRIEVQRQLSDAVSEAAPSSVCEGQQDESGTEPEELPEEQKDHEAGPVEVEFERNESGETSDGGVSEVTSAAVMLDRYLSSGIDDEEKQEEEDPSAGFLEGDPTLERFMRQLGRDEEEIVLPESLGEFDELSDLDEDFLSHLASRMKRRIYIPQQVLLQQGTDLSHVLMLERGMCNMEVNGAALAPTEGPCIIGGLTSLITKKVFTTVVAEETCFVGAIPKHEFARALSVYPDAGQQILTRANAALKRLVQDYQREMHGGESMVRQLSYMPFLSGAAADFMNEFAGMVKLRLLLPGQEVGGSFELDKQGPKLYIIFEGHFHVMLKGAVIATMSPKMVAGVLEVFRIKINNDVVHMKSDDLCKVGAVSRSDLFKLLERFPEERGRFDGLVHNILEDTITMTMRKQPVFSGMPSQFLAKVCTLLQRHLTEEDEVVAEEGERGESLIILNTGKAEVIYRQLPVSMLWPGKSFGSAQLMAQASRYHATVKTKQPCHVLMLSRKSLSTLTPPGHERPWVTALRKRAEVQYSQEKKVFEKKHMQFRCMKKTGLPTASSEPGLRGELGDIMVAHSSLKAWRNLVHKNFVQRDDDGEQTEKADPTKQTSTKMPEPGTQRPASLDLEEEGGSDADCKTPEVQRIASGADEREKAAGTPARFLRFSRGLARTSLDGHVKRPQSCRGPRRPNTPLTPSEQRVPSTPRATNQLVELAELVQEKQKAALSGKSSQIPEDRLQQLAQSVLDATKTACTDVEVILTKEQAAKKDALAGAALRQSRKRHGPRTISPWLQAVQAEMPQYHAALSARGARQRYG